MIGRGLACAALLLAACNSTPLNVGSGELTSPTGLAATGAYDRDLMFIANTGRDGLRALQLCNHKLQVNGSKDPSDTCPESQNGQFIPAPIRVFPAAIDTGPHPLRVAGARLQYLDTTVTPPRLVLAGVALATGVDKTVAVVDARSLLDAQQNPGTSPRPIQYVDVGNVSVDVVTANPLDATFVETSVPAGSTVTAFVATQTELLVLDVGLGTDGFAGLPTIRGRCTLAPVVPTRLAVVPGSAASVYVADGAGDGVVSVATSSIGASSPCTMDRISAGGRSVRSIALSPPWFETNNPVPHAAGELLLMVLEPLSTVQPGMSLDPGGLLFARTGLGSSGTKGIVPIPPFALTDATQEPMQPLSLPRSGFLQEGAFMRAVPPSTVQVAPDYEICPAAPCTPLYIGQPTNSPVSLFSLLAAVTATDGSTYFVEVPARRFVNLNLFLGTLTPFLTQVPGLSPSNSTPPVLTITGCSIQPNGPLCDPSAFQTGLTRNNTWRAIFHAALPGFGVRGGTLMNPNGNSSTLRLSLSQTDLQVWRNDPTIKLDVGDVVSFGSYSLSPSDASAACQTVVNSETAFRFELPILSFPDASTVELAQLADSPDGLTRGFNAAGCTALGVTAEIRTAGTQPWLVFEGDTAKGRVLPDGSFTAVQRRFDYPLDATTYTSNPPIAAHNVSFTFTITPGTVVPKAVFTWVLDSGEAPLAFSDVITAGFATAVLGYSSQRWPSLIFSSVTGSNEVLQANPTILGSQVGGILSYK